MDFGAGSGHLGLLVAFLYPDCEVVLVEPNAVRYETSISRAKELGLGNCTGFMGTLDEFAMVDEEGSAGCWEEDPVDPNR